MKDDEFLADQLDLMKRYGKMNMDQLLHRLRDAEQENDKLRYNHSGEGTVACTCHSYPHNPNCGMDERIARLRHALVEATAALKPFAEFANKFDAHDGTKARVHEWYINIGTQWEASLKLSDCRRAAAKQAEAERVLGKDGDGAKL